MHIANTLYVSREARSSRRVARRRGHQETAGCRCGGGGGGGGGGVGIPHFF